MAEFHDYYELLNIDRFADSQTIENAIKETRKRYRRIESSPDPKQVAKAESMMILLDEAKKILLDANQKAQYDAQYAQKKKEAQQEIEQKQSGPEKNWTEVADEYYDNGQYNKALFAAKEATTHDPFNGYAWYLRTWAAYNLNRYDEAEFAASEALKLNSQLPTMHAILGDIYSDQNKIGAAVTEYEYGAQLDPETAYYPMRIAVLTMDTNKLQGLQLARQAYAKFPNDEGVKQVYLMGLLIAIEDTCSNDGSGTHCYTNEKQIEQNRKLIQEAYAIGAVNDSELMAQLAEEKKLLDGADKNVFINPPTWFWVVVVLHVLGIFAGVIGNPIHWLVLAFIIAYGYFKVFPKQYKINAEVLGARAKTTGQQ